MQSVKLYPNSKIYIFSPRGIRSGGPTLLHQLASVIVKNYSEYNIEPLMFYYDLNVKTAPDSAYSEYHIKKTAKIIDSPENILIGAEGVSEFAYFYPKTQKIIWWLSVDNYVSNLANTYMEFYQKGNYLHPLNLKFNFTDNREIFHFVQSKYAADFLSINNTPKEKIYYVSDYLHPVFLKRANNVDLNKKEPIVVYNPLKGFDFTKKIIDFAPKLKFIPIQNMTPEEVENLLVRAMVYIDFGNHPGKDRIPREAAISGAVVITGKRGAAANNEDIPISAEFKFEDVEREIPNIVEKIEEVFGNFSTYHAKFENYRKIILSEPEKFENDVINALNLKASNKFTKVAMLQSGARGKFLKQIIDEDDSLKAVFRLGDEGNENLENIEKISFGDAIFLYFEGRIQKFMAVSINETEKETIIDKLTLAGVAEDDIMVVEIKR